MTEQVTINMHVDELEGDVSLLVDYHYTGQDSEQTLIDPPEFAEVVIDSVKCKGRAVDEQLSGVEMEELESKVNHEARFGDE